MLWQLVCLTFVSLVLSYPTSHYVSAPPTNGIAFAFSGAGGRIGQLAALAETLINGTYPEGIPIRPSYLTGVSSGAIITVALCAIIESKEQNITGGITFGDLHSILFKLKNSDIFTYNGIKVAGRLKDGFLLDTTPLRKFLTKLLARVKYSTLGDLYIPTTITTIDQRTGASVRLSSTNPLHSTLSLLDVLMCTTAIPVAFSPGTLWGLSRYSHFLDGATGIDAIPIIPLLDVPNLQTAYVITYNYGITSGVIDNSLPFEAEDGTLLKFALQAFDILRANVGIGSIAVLKEAKFAGYIYEPDFTKPFSTVDFGSEELQYNLAKEWASTHNPLSVQLYTLKPSFNPNYTKIDEELAKSSSGYLIIPFTIICILSFLFLF